MASLFSKELRRMDWSGFRRHILAQHSGKPQDLMALDFAIREAESGLGVLARLGHLFHLAPGPGEPYGEFPRLVFHLTSAPNGRLARDEFELWDFGDGWFDSLEEAQLADGYAAQMRGRGGRQRPGLPAILEKGPSLEEVLAARHEEYRKQRAARRARQQEKEQENGRQE